MTSGPSKRGCWLYAAIVVIVAVSTIGFWRMGAKSPESNGQREKVTIGIQTSPAMAVVMVAQDKGFFEQQGIDCELKPFSAGKFALQAQLSGSVDMAGAGDVPVCLANLQGNKVKVITQLVERTVNEVRVVAWKDESAGDPKTYFGAKKRRLSTSLGGGPEMYTYSFLKHFKIPTDGVEIVSQRPEDMPSALQSKSVDAIAVFDPFAFLAEQRLGEDAVTFTDAELYSELYVLCVNEQFLTERRDVAKKVVASLVAAADFIADNPREAQTIVARYTKLEDAVLQGIWQNFVFRPALTNELLPFWAAEVEWARDTEKVPPDTKAPDFRKEVVVTDVLQEVAPDAVSAELK